MLRGTEREFETGVAVCEASTGALDMDGGTGQMRSCAKLHTGPGPSRVAGALARSRSMRLRRSAATGADSDLPSGANMAAVWARAGPAGVLFAAGAGAAASAV